MSKNLTQILDRYRAGKMVIVTDHEGRENEADLVMAAEFADQENIAFMIRYTSGVICVALTPERASELQLPQMVANNQDKKSTAFTVSVDYKVGLTTGISASERARTIVSLASPNTRSSDLIRPGHVFPLVAHKNLLKSRLGHTEAAVVLSMLAGHQLVGVISELVNDDGTMMRGAELKAFSNLHGIPIISISELSEVALPQIENSETKKETFEWSQLPLSNGKWIITSSHGSMGHTHAILSYGEISTEKLLVRIHSECLTGDVFDSKRCDCGEQLKLSIAEIEKAGSGLIIYLRGHEGRGIGLAEKIRAYKLQDSGVDTVEANLMLGHEPDMRNWEDAIAILKNLGIESVELLTNNPDKVAALVNNGISVVQTPIRGSVSTFNKKYLQTKRDLLHHTLGEV
jgi:3,4-dihydroxy 2-butanone 4-phosphate synthase / GTP cyclohydrolase II